MTANVAGRSTVRPLLRRSAAALSCAGLVMTGSALSASAATGTSGSTDLGPSSESRVLVVEKNPASYAAENLVISLGGRVKKQLPAQGGFEARLPAGTLIPVRQSPLVLRTERLEQDPVTGVSACPATDPSCFDALPETEIWQQAIGLDQVPNKNRGGGVTVAVLDTGVTPSADLGERLVARVDLTAEHDGLDHFGHGTHMIGLVAGDGALSLERYSGAAEQADVVSVKVAGWDGATDVSTIVAGLHWVVAHRDTYGIRVVNLSFGTDAAGPTGSDPLAAAVEQAWRAGIVVVMSAGNAGAASSITKPGDDPFAITVGAADIAGTAQPADDVVAAFSSRGPTADGADKPDLLAPGVALVGLRAPGSTIDTFRPAARVGVDYFRGAGTSQASAIVAGVVARMVAANPALTPDQVKGVLLATTDRTLAGAAGGGAGLVDAAQAVALATSAGPLPAANAAAVASTGTGPLQATRGTHPVYADVDGDGVPTLLTGEVDALGTPWTAAAVTTPWSPATWAASPWSAATAEIAGSAPAPAWTGGRVPQLTWEPDYYGAPGWLEAGWDGRYWGGRYWGGRYWGTGMWQ
ncbi:S8 family peptidase [Kineosporia sp. A_224]|uniref:S8 family peptidase n=1 Tax=Kineosporia sp. A_224 TaxID=1962180 RepID=UPI0013045615|nr:S8 family peptidase [Kineosporia sp. A_224]